jgi:hypothetical protein
MIQGVAQLNSYWEFRLHRSISVGTEIPLYPNSSGDQTSHRHKRKMGCPPFCVDFRDRLTLGVLAVVNLDSVPLTLLFNIAM